MKYNTPASQTSWFFEEQHEQQQQEQQPDPATPPAIDEAAARQYFESKGFKILDDTGLRAAVGAEVATVLKDVDLAVEETFGVKKSGQKTTEFIRGLKKKDEPTPPTPPSPDPQPSTQLSELQKKLDALEKRANDAEAAARSEKVNAAITTGLGGLKIAAPEGAEATMREVAESAFRTKFTGELKDGKLTFKDAQGVAQVDASGNPKTVEALFREHFGALVAVDKTPSGSGQNGGAGKVGYLGDTKEQILEALHKKGLIVGQKEHDEAYQKALEAIGLAKK